MAETKTILPQIRDANGLKAIFEKMKPQIMDVLPKHITAERVLKMVLMAASKNAKLFRCTPESWMETFMRSSELGLDCSGTLGQAYVVPYWNKDLSAYEAKYMPGYRGLIELAHRGKEGFTIDVHNVYEKDKLRLVLGTHQVLEHEPYLGQGGRGEHLLTYMVVTFKDGSKQIEKMTAEEIEHTKNCSPAKDSGPWKTFPGEMQRKTVVKRGLKFVPLTPELAKAILYDNEIAGYGFDTNIIDIEPGVDRVESLKERIKNGHQEPAQPTESDKSGEDSKENPPQDEPEKSSLTEKDGSPGPKKYVKPDKPKPDLDARISEDQKVELQEIIHEDSIGKSAVSLILESHGAKLISELRGKDFVSVKQALREVRK